MTCIRISLFSFFRSNLTWAFDDSDGPSPPIHFTNRYKKGFKINVSDISSEIGYKTIASTVDWNPDKHQKKWYFYGLIMGCSDFRSLHTKLNNPSKLSLTIICCLPDPRLIVCSVHVEAWLSQKISRDYSRSSPQSGIIKSNKLHNFWVHFRATTRFIDEKDLSDHVETGNAVSQFSDRKSFGFVSLVFCCRTEIECVRGFVRELGKDWWCLQFSRWFEPFAKILKIQPPNLPPS
jgi:hypothetical protein